MPTSEKFIKSQLKMFVEHPRFPDEFGQKLLVRAFEEACETDEDVRAIAEHLLRISEFAPLPANVYKAAEHLAQQRAALQDSPSPYARPGEHDGSLVDGMTEEDIMRWNEIAARPGDRPWQKANRELAKGILQTFYERHPERKHG
jgi:hypothetical protein